MVFNALSHDNKWNISAVFSQQTVVLKANDFFALLHTWNFYIQMHVLLDAFILSIKSKVDKNSAIQTESRYVTLEIVESKILVPRCLRANEEAFKHVRHVPKLYG